MPNFLDQLELESQALRAPEMQSLSAKLKFDSFKPGPDGEFPMGWSFLRRLSQGQDRYAFNILQGTYQEQSLFVFDYHYQINNGQDSSHYFFTILMLIFKQVFPKVMIVTKIADGPLSRVVESLDTEDIKFESVDFSRLYRVRSADKKFAYDVCNPQMMDYLLANRDLEIEINGPAISLTFAPQLPVSRIKYNLERLAQIRALLPQYLFTT